MIWLTYPYFAHDPPTRSFIYIVAWKLVKIFNYSDQSWIINEILKFQEKTVAIQIVYEFMHIFRFLFVCRYSIYVLYIRIFKCRTLRYINETNVEDENRVTQIGALFWLRLTSPAPLQVVAYPTICEYLSSSLVDNRPSTSRSTTPSKIMSIRTPP